MTGTFTWRHAILTLALLTALATSFAAIPTIAASAAPAGHSSPDRAAASSAELPTLTNDVGQPPGGAERQLPLGITLLAIGLLGLVLGVSVLRSPASQAYAGRDARGMRSEPADTSPDRPVITQTT